MGVRRIVLTAACLVVLSAIALGGAAAVLAQGTSTSAGDNQYVDPLTSTTSTSHPSGSSSSSSSGSSGSSSSSSTSNSSLSQTPSSVASGSASSSGSSAGGTSSAGSRTLPFTGMNVWAGVAIGLGLLGTGIVLRRTVRAT